jgi:fumarate reductase flavoprotein subunit
MAHAAIQRKESRGAHQRLDEGCTTRNDAQYLKHSLSFYRPDGAPEISWDDVKITRLPPAKRVYGAESEGKEAVHE